jgi:hypothetical protein
VIPADYIESTTIVSLLNASKAYGMIPLRHMAVRCLGVSEWPALASYNLASTPFENIRRTTLPGTAQYESAIVTSV